MVKVIGGSGFVGSFLIEELKEFEVSNLDKNPSPFFNQITTIGDIRKKEDLIFSKEVKAVILLAAEHRDDVSPISLYYDVNVEGTRNVLEAMDIAGVRTLIFTSSVAVYGLNKINPDENCFAYIQQNSVSNTTDYDEDTGDKGTLTTYSHSYFT